MTDTKITDLMATLDVTRKGAERISDIINAGAGLLLEEGLHAVSAFRPALVERNYEFKQRLLRRINDIMRGE